MATSTTKSDKLSSLTEPLLLVEAAVSQEEAEENDTSNNINNMVRAKILTSLLGCFMALASHSILSVCLWKETILQGSTSDIVIFSLQWSFWTCLILFAAMIIFFGSINNNNKSNNKNSDGNNNNNNNIASNEKDQQEQDDHAFQLEAQYVVASLLTISAIWIMDSIVICLTVLALLCLLVAGMKDQGIMGSYSLVAGTLGLIFGACSQFILSLWMWQDVGMKDPIIDHIVLFSLVWSGLTVVMTFAGCLSLRWIVENKTNGNTRRAILRMEAVYVAMTLVGICAAWIFLDVTAGLPQQIIPSILMLIASLAAFTLILYCFPEDSCLVDEEKGELMVLMAKLLDEEEGETEGNEKEPPLVDV